MCAWRDRLAELQKSRLRARASPDTTTDANVSISHTWALSAGRCARLFLPPRPLSSYIFLSQDLCVILHSGGICALARCARKGENGGA